MKKNILAGTMVLGLVLGSFGIASTSNAAAPIVTAGPAQAIVLPASSVSLTGSATFSESATAIASYGWVLTSGPGVTPAVVITQPSAVAAAATASGLITAGVYMFTLTATDDAPTSVFTGTATTTVTVAVSPVVTPLPPVKVIKSKLEINPNGKVNLQGELMSLPTGNTLTVKVWGIIFTVNTTTVKFNGKVLDITGYTAGDMISINGKIDSLAQTPTIIARNIKNMTAQSIKSQQNSKPMKPLKATKEAMKENRGNSGTDR